MRVEEHTGEIAGQPVFWRSAPTDGTPPLYVHGVPTCADDWTPLLARTGGLAPDLLGFGRSGKGGHNDYSIDGIAAFVERFLALVGVERVKLVVHDWGAAALRFAIAHPERVERLVVVNAVPLLPGYRWHWVARLWRRPLLGELAMGLTFRWTLRWALDRACADRAPEPLVSAAWRHFDQGTQRAILRLYRSAPESALAVAGAGLADVRAPTLVVWGALDPFIAPSFADAYARALPDARVEHVEGAGHWPWLEQPGLVERIATFLAQG